MSKNLLHEWREGNLDEVDTFEKIHKTVPTHEDEWVKEQKTNQKENEK